MRIVLVTGSTGFIGGAVAAHLLASDPGLRLIPLVRAASREGARLRVAASLGRFLDAGALEAAMARVEPLVGDLLDPGILDDRRLAPVTHVLHLAA
jgi:thioester reductase-like protein